VEKVEEVVEEAAVEGEAPAVEEAAGESAEGAES
jgi:hypothetical protein